MKLLLVCAIVFLLNLPFGFWRGSVSKFSRQWFLAIHLPVPVVILIRIYSGLGFHLASFPAVIGSFFLGQFIGGKLTRLKKQKDDGT